MRYSRLKNFDKIRNMIILPSQNQSIPHLNPHQRLRFAMLNQAMKDVIDYADFRNAIFRNALMYIRDNSDSYALSFVACCQALNIEPDYLRKLIYNTLYKKSKEKEL